MRPERVAEGDPTGLPRSELRSAIGALAASIKYEKKHTSNILF